MNRNPEPLERLVFVARQLMDKHPPVWRHPNPNKRLVFGIACPPGCLHKGELTYSRWAAMLLPETIDARGAAGLVEGRPDVYDYAPTAINGALEWHVNFADPHLFFAYGSPLFAQDEMQVAEHPALGALREALAARGRDALTVEPDGRPTPVLVKGVERRCRVATDCNAGELRPHGLYGNAFARADPEAIKRATARIDPPAITNILAMAAPHGGRGRYTREEIETILVTAYSGFRAAALESQRGGGPATPVVVHTGFWGCGAFGGDRRLMAMLQALAAGMAGLDRLVFHAFDPAGAKTLQDALGLMNENLAGEPEMGLDRLLDRIAAMGFAWGVSDGN
jgi:hypothetical protein